LKVVPEQLFVLLKHPHAVDNRASSNSSWVVEMVLLLTSRNKSAINAKLDEFIFSLL